MNKLLPEMLVLLFLSLLSAVDLHAAQVVIDSEDQFHFAEETMRKGEHLRAAAEFERFIHFFPGDKRVPQARLLIGFCHLLARDYESARKNLEKVYSDYPDRADIGGEALFLVGESYYTQGIFSESQYYFIQIIGGYPDSEIGNRALYRLGWSFMQTDKWQEAAQVFQEVRKGSPLFPISLDLATRSLAGETLPYKNPSTAGLMAGVLPGLGHAYSDRYKDGMVAFLLNGLFIWAAVQSFDKDQKVLGGILTFLELGWYSGNIYSAVNAAHKYNRKIRGDYLRDLPDALRLSPFATKEGHLGLALRIDF